MPDIANQKILWNLQDIMLAAGVSRASAYRIVSQPGFPKPVRLPGMNPKWFAEEVREYFRDRQAA